MDLQSLHSAQQILQMMDRIYHHGMTTTSGGNLSIRDENGDTWITPAGVDKGSLRIEDMVCVKADGTVEGMHKPSSEFPFHQLIYQTRSDLKAIVHAHPPALVSFSIVRKIPDTRLLPNEWRICGSVGMAMYALPGSEQLGQNIADVFGTGINCVILENHGVVVGGTNLFEAFKAFETLDFCARLQIEATRIGQPTVLSDDDYELVKSKSSWEFIEFVSEAYSAAESQTRAEMCRFVHRAYEQGLFTSTQGTLSRRLNEREFLITPTGLDRMYLSPDDFVKIRDGKIEAGKIPSASVLFHQALYQQHTHVDSVILAHPPNVMAFAVTNTTFDTRTIPESYILLRQVPKFPFNGIYTNPMRTARTFDPSTPIAIVQNNCIVVTGQGLLNTFDRLEVTEYTAKSILAAKALGPIAHIDDSSIAELISAFHLPS